MGKKKLQLRISKRVSLPKMSRTLILFLISLIITFTFGVYLYYKQYWQTLDIKTLVFVVLWIIVFIFRHYQILLKKVWLLSVLILLFLGIMSVIVWWNSYYLFELIFFTLYWLIADIVLFAIDTK